MSRIPLSFGVVAVIPAGIVSVFFVASLELVSPVPGALVLLVLPYRPFGADGWLLRRWRWLIVMVFCCWADCVARSGIRFYCSAAPKALSVAVCGAVALAPLMGMRLEFWEVEGPRL